MLAREDARVCVYVWKKAQLGWWAAMAQSQRGYGELGSGEHSQVEPQDSGRGSWKGPALGQRLMESPGRSEHGPGENAVGQGWREQGEGLERCHSLLGEPLPWQCRQ